MKWTGWGQTTPGRPAAFVRAWRGRRAILAPGVIAAAALAGCADLAYYGQAFNGHARVLNTARPLNEVIDDPATATDLRAQLVLARSLRAFAVTALGLPDNASYRRYTDLGRRHPVWNVAAAPPDSLTLKSWCFPVLGCVSYRGYYDEAQARALGESLTREGWEVSVYGIAAYSTLGWFDAVGGDPLLSSFVRLPEGELARLLFHEMAHQQLYVVGDTAFNESYASAVEHIGVSRWLLEEGSAAARTQFAQTDAQRRAFRALTQATRDALLTLYGQAPEPGELATRKAAVMANFRSRYEALRADWQTRGWPHAGYDAWVARANNASFAMQTVYDGWVPALLEQYRRQGCALSAWQAQMQALTALSHEKRQQQLAQWAAQVGEPAAEPQAACEAADQRRESIRSM